MMIFQPRPAARGIRPPYPKPTMKMKTEDYKTEDRRRDLHCQTCLEQFDAEDRPRLARFELIFLVSVAAIMAGVGTWFFGKWAVIGLLAGGIFGCMLYTVLLFVSVAKDEGRGE
jgi:hypothetical protein